MYAVSGDGKRTEHASYNEAIERFKEIRAKGIQAEMGGQPLRRTRWRGR